MSRLAFAGRAAAVSAAIVGLVTSAELRGEVEATPESQGVSSRQILEWIRRCERPGFDLRGFVIRRHGKVIAEGSWKPFDTLSRPHMLWSHSKTLTATAIGFLADAGKLDLDARLVALLPDKAPAVPSENLRQVRVRDLLTMNLGAERTEAWRDDADGDWERAMLANKIDNPPGTAFRYDSGATYLLSVLVGRLSGKTTMDYLQEKLFAPLCISNAWSSVSPSGTPCGGWGMRMTTRDMAKVGQLYLDRGVWNGRQLLSAHWVELAGAYQTASMTAQGGDVALGYGFQTWRSRLGYRADGAFGQFTLVLSDLDAVVSLHAAQQDQRDELNLVWEALIPAFRDGELFASDADCAALREKCRNLAFKALADKGGKTDPRLLNVTYAIARNRHLSSVRLAETESGWLVTLVTPAGEYAVPAGRGSFARGKLKFANAPYEKIDSIWGEHEVVSCGAVGDDGSLRLAIYPLDHTARMSLQLAVRNGEPTLEGHVLAFADSTISGRAQK